MDIQFLTIKTHRNAAKAYLTQLYLQALNDPNSNIEYIIITDGGVPIIIQPKGG